MDLRTFPVEVRRFIGEQRHLHVDYSFGGLGDEVGYQLPDRAAAVLARFPESEGPW